MHSCDFCVTDEWIRHYHATLKHFVNQVPEMARVGPQIDEVSMFCTSCDGFNSAV